MNEEVVAWCALNRVFGYHPSIALNLLNTYGSASELFRCHPPLPANPDLSDQLSQATLDWASRELESVDRLGCRFIHLGDDDYPVPLSECEDPPLGLYLRGSSSPAEIFSLRPMVAIVGTRDVSPYGSIWCKRIVNAMAEATVKPCIVSGLAFGVDGTAHSTALEHGLSTIGVMATGIETVYPAQHRELASRIAASPGCALVTDYPLRSEPVALSFVRRNRIIAGLAGSVTVIESRKKGGSLMTAKYACDYNRDVFAVPGRLDDVRSSGCNSLIAAHMAEIVTSPEELVEKLGLMPRSRRKADRRSAFRRAIGARYVAAGGHAGTGVCRSAAAMETVGLCVFDNPGVGFAEISALTSLPYATVLECAGILEADGFIVTDLLQRCSPAAKW
ncbi:MAG: DNA-processing protein DprA [Bacteroidales bacterium]|nr:DNA-processing protein DprA [Bacteroidales bacterium]